MRVSPLLAALALLTPGCSTTLDAGSYSSSCAVDTDCTAVHSGDVCAVCGCPNAAIAASESTRFGEDSSRLQSLCGPRPAVACGACMEVSVACIQGRCALR